MSTTSAPIEYHHVNTAQVEGVVVKIWQYNRDVYVRLACYDAHAEPLPIEEHEADPGAGQAGPRRQASYVSFWLKQGRTADRQSVCSRKTKSWSPATCANGFFPSRWPGSSTR